MVYDQNIEIHVIKEKEGAKLENSYLKWVKKLKWNTKADLQKQM